MGGHMYYTEVHMSTETKKCPSCLEVKSFDLFKLKKGKPTYCKVCWNSKMKGKRASAKKEPKRNRLLLTNMSAEERKKHIAALNKAAKKRKIESNRRYVWSLLTEAKCTDCGLTNPLVLQFDHIDPAIKSNDISDLMNSSPKKLKEEIEKCEIVCANCHICRTAKMFGSWRLAYIS